MKLSEKLIDNVDGEDVKVRHIVFTVSNFLSFTRIPAAASIVYLHTGTHNAWEPGIIALLLYIVLSDYLDGFMARWLDQISELGKALDPIGDKLCAFILFVYLIVLGWIPMWFLWFFMIRDGLILLGSVWIKYQYGKVAMSVMSGKIAVNVLAFYWLAVFFYPELKELHQQILWGTMIILVYSFVDYMIRFLKIFRGARFN